MKEEIHEMEKETSYEHRWKDFLNDIRFLSVLTMLCWFELGAGVCISAMFISSGSIFIVIASTFGGILGTYLIWDAIKEYIKGVLSETLNER